MPSPVILWYEPENASPKVSFRDFSLVCQTLGTAGFEHITCSNASQLLSKAERISRGYVTSNGGYGWMLGVLCASLAENAALAHLLRAGQPSMGLVACVPDQRESTCLLALQSGIDAWFTPDASERLVVATVFSLLRRMGGVDPLALPGADPTGWQLVDHAWKLQLPSGEQVTLTTLERAFMLALTSCEGRSATHEQLTSTMGLHDVAAGAEIGRERISVMVSRLRRKVKALGAELPVRSLHGKGYLFNGPMP